VIFIESIEFSGFDAKRLEFKEGSINLLEEEETTKTLIPAAVLAIFYGLGPDGQEINKFRSVEQHQEKFQASIIVRNGQQRLKISRDFTDNHADIVDLVTSGNEAAKPYSAEPAAEPGVQLTKLDKEEFRTKCIFIGKETNYQSVENGNFLPAHINDSESASIREAQAIKVLDKILNQYPYKSENVLVTIQVDFFIAELKKQLARLEQRISDYDQKRMTLLPLIIELDEIEAELLESAKTGNAAEYFKLCLRAAEIDANVLQLRSNSIRIHRIEQELSRIGHMQDFPIHLQPELEELWKQRSTLMSDYENSEVLFSKQMREYEQEESTVRQRWQGLQNFTPEQSQMLSVLSRDFQSCQQDLDQLNLRLSTEEASLNESSSDKTITAKMAEYIRVLGKHRAEEAKTYTVLVGAFSKELNNADRSRLQNEMAIKELEEQQKEQPGASKVLRMLKPSVSKQTELEAAKLDLQRQQTGVLLLRNKIGILEQLLGKMAVDTGLASGFQLMQQSQKYIDQEEQLKNLELTREAIVRQNIVINNLKAELRTYFLQACREGFEIEPTTSNQLAADVRLCLEDYDRLNQSFSSIESNKKQLDSLLAQMTSTEKLLEEFFTKALSEEMIPGFTQGKFDLELCYREFYSNVAKYHHSESLHNDLARIQEKTSVIIGEENIYNAIVKLEQERQRAWERIHDLVEQCPEIAEASPPANQEELVTMIKVEENKTAGLRLKQTNLKAEIANFFSDYDKHYLDLLENMSKVGKDLRAVERNKSGLALSRNVLEMILDEEIAGSRPPEELSLPLIIDSAYLAEEEAVLFVTLKFLSQFLANKRQIIIINTNRTLNLQKAHQLKVNSIKRG
jgi:hypothetical protein